MLDINPILLLVTLAVFISLITYLNYTLYNPLLKYMDDRDAKLKRERDSVSQNSSDVDSLKKEAEDILTSAREEAASIKEAMISEAKESIAKRLLEKKSSLADEYEEFTKSLQQEREGVRAILVKDSDSIEKALKDRFSSI
jgi:F-type H+-transporting ATPase subunit b